MNLHAPTFTANLSRTVSILSFFAVSSMMAGMTPKSGIPYDLALRDAEAVAARRESWQVMRGAGQSMLPLYGENSVLVVERGSFQALKSGMVAVYRDVQGDLVAHRLNARSGGGWIAKGINNRVSDPSLVTENNFVGLVFGVFNAADAPQAEIVASMDRLPVVIGKQF